MNTPAQSRKKGAKKRKSPKTKNRSGASAKPATRSSPSTRAKPSHKPRATGKRRVESTDEKAPILLSATLPGGGPGEWNEGEPLRATVLLHAPEEVSRYLRLFAEGLFSPLLERGPIETLKYRGSYVKAKLRAAIEARIEKGRGQRS